MGALMRNIVIGTAPNGEVFDFKADRIQHTTSLENTVEWRKSIEDRSEAEVILFQSVDSSLPYYREPKRNPYYERFKNAYIYLQENEDVGFAWVTDSTDVTMNKDPFVAMEEDIFYISQENVQWNRAWKQAQIHKHINSFDRRYLRIHGNNKFLNCGVLGGDRATLLKFFELLFIEWDKIYNSDNGMVDMYLSNMITYKHFSENYVLIS